MVDPTDTPLFRWGYALCKQLPSMYAISSNYGGIDLTEDDEIREAVRAAVEPILRRRIEAAKGGAVMSDLTPIEAAVVHMISKPLRIPAPWADLPALFVLRATEDPDALLQAVYNCVDWDAINEHMEQHA